MSPRSVEICRANPDEHDAGRQPSHLVHMALIAEIVGRE